MYSYTFAYELFGRYEPTHAKNLVERYSPLLCFTTITSETPSMSPVSSSEAQKILAALVQL